MKGPLTEGSGKTKGKANFRDTNIQYCNMKANLNQQVKKHIN
jgi:hypothetical protein